jgi:hypothetical protein
VAKSRYEKNIVRKAAIFVKQQKGVKYEEMKLEQPDVIPVKKPDTGPLILWSPKLVPDTCQVVEYGMITGDVMVGDGGPNTLKPFKSYDDGGIYFLLLGTNPDDLSDLGAEVEFWMGEDETLEKVVINTPSCIYVPPGVGRWPMKWKNVKRPVMFVVLVPNFTEKSRSEPVSYEGRPMYQPK